MRTALKLMFSLIVVTLLSVVAISKPFLQGRYYTGQVVSIDFNGDVQGFLDKMASISGLDIHMASDINRIVTIHVHDVPWDLALDTVLKNSGFSSEGEGNVLRVAAADPLRGENRLQVGTVTIEGTLSAFQLQNPRTLLEVNAPDADGKMQNWHIEWESADDLAQDGIRPNMLKAGDQVIVTGNLTRTTTLRLVILRRPSGAGFSWGGISAFSSGPSSGTMYVSSHAK